MQIITKLIADLNVTEEKIATSAITSGKIASGAVTDTKLAASAKQSVLESKFVKAMIEATNFSAGSSSSISFGQKFLSSTGTSKFGGSTTAEGLITSSPDNVCAIRDYTEKSPIEDASGNDVYGRLTDTSTTLTGTLDWTQSSGTVSGTGTAFLTEVAVNDILIGPDSALYRVTTVTDDTTIVVTPVYAGTTATGQTTDRHRITLLYYSLVSNVETAFTMTGQTIDLQYPESYDLHSLPFNALTTGVAWTDIVGPADHNHDGRYFTETEIGATSGTTGAALVGFDKTGLTYITTATNVQDALEQIDGAISGAGHYHAYETHTPSGEDADITLDYTPLSASQVVMIVGGVPQRYGTDYSVSGKVVSWSFAGAGFHIGTSDDIWFIYAHTGS